jgi:hypothetical protein
LTKSDPNKADKTKPLIGGVKHDARGNAVWQWATETARHAVASTSQLLRRLDLSSLSLEDTQASKSAPGRSAPAKAAPGKPASAKPVPPLAGAKPGPPGRSERTGFDPYDGAAAARAKPAGAKAPGAAARPRPAAPAAPRASWWRRLLHRR